MPCDPFLDEYLRTQVTAIAPAAIPNIVNEMATKAKW